MGAGHVLCERDIKEHIRVQSQIVAAPGVVRYPAKLRQHPWASHFGSVCRLGDGSNQTPHPKGNTFAFNSSFFWTLDGARASPSCPHPVSAWKEARDGRAHAASPPLLRQSQMRPYQIRSDQSSLSMFASSLLVGLLLNRDQLLLASKCRVGWHMSAYACVRMWMLCQQSRACMRVWGHVGNGAGVCAFHCACACLCTSPGRSRRRCGPARRCWSQRTGTPSERSSSAPRPQVETGGGAQHSVWLLAGGGAQRVASSTLRGSGTVGTHLCAPGIGKRRVVTRLAQPLAEDIESSAS